MALLKSIYAFLLDTVQTILLAAAVFLVIYVFLFRTFEVNGQSMYPTFHNGEMVFTNLITLRFSPPKRGDVVVLKAPDEPEKDYIKRIIGEPGDTLFIRDGDVHVNNQKLDESTYLKSDVRTNSGSFLQENQPVIVPSASFFVMGDNRSNSKDSRAFGFIRQDTLVGKSFFVFWPLERMRLIN